jgi:hypothetical protein
LAEAQPGEKLNRRGDEGPASTKKTWIIGFLRCLGTGKGQVSCKMSGCGQGQAMAKEANEQLMKEGLQNRAQILVSIIRQAEA